jgi:hypothetical protein
LIKVPLKLGSSWEILSCPAFLGLVFEGRFILAQKRGGAGPVFVTAVNLLKSQQLSLSTHTLLSCLYIYLDNWYIHIMGPNVVGVFFELAVVATALRAICVAFRELPNRAAMLIAGGAVSAFINCV